VIELWLAHVIVCAARTAERDNFKAAIRHGSREPGKRCQAKEYKDKRNETETQSCFHWILQIGSKRWRWFLSSL